MKKIILIGNVACGKTTICQYLNHMEIKYKKTQALEVYNTTIDTPGEYLENRRYQRSLMVQPQRRIRLFLCRTPAEISSFSHRDNPALLHCL